MKCPHCNATLMPEDGVMFCLQCGDVVALGSDEADKGPKLEDTTDPVLQRAITDSTRGRVHFRLPVSEVQPRSKTKLKAFGSMRASLVPPHPLASGVGASAPAVPTP